MTTLLYIYFLCFASVQGIKISSGKNSRVEFLNLNIERGNARPRQYQDINVEKSTSQKIHTVNRPFSLQTSTWYVDYKNCLVN